MLGSGLPCFKGESTLKRLQQRFQLDRTERAAAEFMMERIFQSFENRRTVFYDYFQKATNGKVHSVLRVNQISIDTNIQYYHSLGIPF